MPHEHCKWLHAETFVAYVEKRFSRESYDDADLDASQQQFPEFDEAQRRAFRRWRTGKSAKVSFGSADAVLVALGGELWELPREVWIEDRAG